MPTIERPPSPQNTPCQGWSSTATLLLGENHVQMQSSIVLFNAKDLLSSSYQYRGRKRTVYFYRKRCDMDFSLVCEMIGYTLFVILGILGLYILFCWLYVSGSRTYLRRLDDIGWKKVDYVWIAIGSMGLMLQFIQIGLDSKMASLSMEESFGRLDAQNLNIAASELSGSSICLQTPPADNDEDSNNLGAELADACKTFQIIRPTKPRSTVVDPSIFMHFEIVNVDTGKIKSQVLAAKVKNFKQAFTEYENQAQSIQDIRKIASTYKSYLLFLKILSTLSLIVAIALRLAKVTGEIRLKTHPIVSKVSEAIPKNELKEKLESLVTVPQAAKLEDKI